MGLPRGSLECNPEIPAFPGEEYYVPNTRLGEVTSALQSPPRALSFRGGCEPSSALPFCPGFPWSFPFLHVVKQRWALLGFSRQEHWSGLPFPPPMHESEK